MPPNFIKRPASSLRFEPLKPSAEEVICLGSDTEETYEESKRKRRRVEAAARHYIQGRPLFISTATLKGPFDDGWVNPWARQTKNWQAKEDIVGKKLGQKSNTPVYQSSEGNNKAHYDSPNSFVTAVSVKEEASEDFWTPRNHKSWLKSNRALLDHRQRHKSQSSTPTPESRWQNYPSINLVNGVNNLGKQMQRGSPLKNLNHSYRKPSADPNHKKSSKRPRLSSTVEPNNSKKDIHHGAGQDTDDDDSNWQNNRGVRQQSLNDADNESHRSPSDARSIKQQTALKASNRAMSAKGVRQVPNDKEEITVANPLLAKARANRSLPQALPPSTYLPEFQYCYGSRKPSCSPERLSFAEELKIAKEKATAEAKKGLSFTASGSVRRYTSRTTSPNTKREAAKENRQAALSHHHAIGNSRGSYHSQSVGMKNLTTSSNPQSGDKQTTRSLETFPEAQVVMEPTGRLPSAPSTELLETDKKSLKFPSTDEHGPCADLSTQAALAKAQRRFRDEISPISPASPSLPEEHATQSGLKTPIDAAPPGPSKPDMQNLTPVDSDEEPMSTQAMVDAISPFAATTVKKNPTVETWASFAPPPSRAGSLPSPLVTENNAQSTSISTSPSPPPAPSNEPPVSLTALSKPSSTITSFSIAPNGSLTEVLQQDGQQQNVDMNDWDLEAAIEEAGSFLGDWDLEAEARKEGRASLGSKENASMATKGILTKKAQKAD